MACVLGDGPMSSRERETRLQGRVPRVSVGVAAGPAVRRVPRPGIAIPTTACVMVLGVGRSAILGIDHQYGELTGGAGRYATGNTGGATSTGSTGGTGTTARSGAGGTGGGGTTARSSTGSTGGGGTTALSSTGGTTVTTGSGGGPVSTSGTCMTQPGACVDSLPSESRWRSLRTIAARHVRRSTIPTTSWPTRLPVRRPVGARARSIGVVLRERSDGNGLEHQRFMRHQGNPRQRERDGLHARHG